MARKITDIQNTDAATTDYPSGKTRDKSGATQGSIGGEAAFGDMHQFFAKLMRDTSPVVTPNSLPDNETNGYQFFEAFINYARNVLIATESAKGAIEIASKAESISGDGTNLAVVANQYKDTKTVANGIITVSQTGGNYTINDTYDVYHFSSATPPDVTMPDPTSYKNRVIVVFSTQNTPIDINNTAPGGSQNNEFYPTMYWDPTSETLINSLHTFLSDGYRWISLSQAVEAAACPYIYINGVYHEEILKNHLRVGNYKEETISLPLVEGENTIRLSEEKKEITFIDYLILNIDGKDEVLFNERKTLKIGDFYDFVVNVPFHKKATLRAKGYYIKD